MDVPTNQTRKSRPTEEYNDPGEPELYNRMMKMPEPYRSYAAFTYLIGNRISEGVPGKSVFKDSKSKNKITRDFYGVHKSDIVFGEDGWMEVKKLPTLKRKLRDSTKFYRDGILFVNGRGEKPFVNILIEYLNTKQDGDLLWNHSRKTSWHYFNTYLKIPPKKLRGLRATKDAKQYGLGALELKEKYNWGSTDMPFHYAKFNNKAMKNKMEESNK